MYSESDLLPLSALQHLAFCERQWGLIHLEQQWNENRLTAEGRLLHENADTETTEIRDGVRTCRGLRIRSLRYGIAGRADVVEFRADGPRPVEYKRGKPKSDDMDEVQLCAQALCLEEMLGVTIPEGSLFYGEPRRRTPVPFDQVLRQRVEALIARLHELTRAAVTPAPVYAAKCKSCSLLQICGPKSTGGKSARQYMQSALREALRPVKSEPRLMKQLLNTLYITTQDSYLSRDGETALVRVGDEVRLRVPVHTLGSIVCFGRVMCTPGLMSLCAEKQVYLAFLTERGRFIGRFQGPISGNVLLRRQQYRMAGNEEQSVAVAACFVAGKIANARTVLLRGSRESQNEEASRALDKVCERMARLVELTQTATSLEGLLGIEGEAGRSYFGVMDLMIGVEKESFFLKERSRRPPLDNLNALLSFLYTLLAGDCVGALESVGLDPAVGFLHQDRPGRPSLALDLMEELRSVLADRLALTLINRRQVKPAGFHRRESGAISMDEATRKEVLVAWQKRKQEEVQHPFLGEKVAIGLLPYAQALLLARHVRGDLDGYPALIWK